MDTSIFCVYNLERRVFLSSKVTIVDGVSEPLKVVRLLVTGLGVDAESSLWLTNLFGMPSVPKLFPYDLVCLDKDLRIVETIEVLPGVEFVQHQPEVSSAFVLPPETLRTTRTRIGDHLLVWPGEQADQLLADLEKNPASVENPSEAVLVGVSGAQEPIRNGHSVVSGGGALPGSPHVVAEPPGEPHASVTVAQSAANSDETLGRAQTPSVSITEAIVEKDPSVGRAFTGVERWGLEDLFGNWVDSPAAPPSWIAQKARERATEISPPETPVARTLTTAENHDLHSQEKAVAPPAEQAPLEMAQAEPTTPPPTEQKTEPRRPSASMKAAVPAAISQPAQRTTFTITQYGMWQVSAPTVAGPMPAAKHIASNGAASQNGTKRDAGSKREEPAKRENGFSPKKTNGIAATRVVSTPAKAKERQASAFFAEKPPAVQGDVEKVELGATLAVPTNGVIPSNEELPDDAPEQALENGLAAVSVSQPSSRYDTDSPSSEATTDRSRNGHGTAEALSKPSQADFAIAVQDKFDRLQSMKAPTPRAGSAFEKKTSREQSEPAVKAQTGVLKAPTKPIVNAEARSGASEPQRGSSMTPPATRFPRPKADQNGKSKSSQNGSRKDGAQAIGLGARFKRWLNPTPAMKGERRRAYRRYVPGMVAHYFTGGAPKPHDIADISMSGIYLQTDDRWLPDTMIRMTLQKPCARGERKQSITVLSRIVRRGSDGVAAEFVMEESLDPDSREILPSHATDRFALARFL